MEAIWPAVDWLILSAMVATGFLGLRLLSRRWLIALGFYSLLVAFIAPASFATSRPSHDAFDALRTEGPNPLTLVFSAIESIGGAPVWALSAVTDEFEPVLKQLRRPTRTDPEAVTLSWNSLRRCA
ncbi:hypothetical protein Pan189_09760 [Stratiformator vulcanicus]|uniref:Uncharacterized protein n=1 Tax=Stratiformator vulcanicus TaxID=2527980 RepID=A0A517QY62_9PLAN|nr:hypothetical protein Pan189_09760 [Stratiformator vulcanicus]